MSPTISTSVVFLLLLSSVQGRSVRRAREANAMSADAGGDTCMSAWLMASLHLPRAVSRSVATKLTQFFQPIDERNADTHRSSFILPSVVGSEANVHRFIDCLTKQSSSCRSQAPCLNGGQCLFESNAVTGHRLYKCNCMAGYTGDRCQTSMNGCDSSPCLNGGTCKTLASGGYTCDCTPLFRGQNCEDGWFSWKKFQTVVSANVQLAHKVDQLEAQLNDMRHANWNRTQTFLKSLRLGGSSQGGGGGGGGGGGAGGGGDGQACTGIHHYTYKTFPALDNEMNQGLVLRFPYTKKRSDTVLRITGNFNYRVTGRGDACSKWTFEIDNWPCIDPEPIEAVSMTSLPSENNLNRRMLLTGFCRRNLDGDIQSGHHDISLVVGRCSYIWTSAGDASTGWQATSTFIVEEYCP